MTKKSNGLTRLIELMEELVARAPTIDRNTVDTPLSVVDARVRKNARRLYWLSDNQADVHFLESIPGRVEITWNMKRAGSNKFTCEGWGLYETIDNAMKESEGGDAT